MRKFRIICILVLCAIFAFALSACDTPTNDDSQFEEGVEHGMEDIFLRIYDASDLRSEEFLMHGDCWQTKHFEIVFEDEELNGDRYLHFKLELKTTTVERCFDYGEVYFNIYAMSDSQGMLLEYDNFLDYGLINYDGSTDEFLDGNIVEASIKLIDNADAQTMIIIIIVEGSLYTATYYT